MTVRVISQSNNILRSSNIQYYTGVQIHVHIYLYPRGIIIDNDDEYLY